MTVNVTATYHTQSIKTYTLHTQTFTFKIYRTFVRIEENRVSVRRQCNGDFSEISISNEFNSSMKSTNKSNECYVLRNWFFILPFGGKHLPGMVSSVKHKLNDDGAAKAAIATVTTTTRSGLFVSVTRH